MKELPDIKKYLINLQKQISHWLLEEDGQINYQEDPWQHTEGGGGLSCIFAQGNYIERAGVNFSHVHGKFLPQSATVKRPDLVSSAFEAMGVSVVIHPVNPYIPTTHANVRFVKVELKNQTTRWWFGGGFDLTPYYGFAEDCAHWHKMAKSACIDFGKDVYANYKKWCDEYFYLKHRAEPRGIGGIFFDDLNQWGFDTSFAFMRSVGDHFIEAYKPIFIRRKSHPYNDAERAFQCYRRGRYVEFNLLYDRGTLFGIQSGGRVESILMSLPPIVHWQYPRSSYINQAEKALLENFLKVQDWGV